MLTWLLEQVPLPLRLAFVARALFLSAGTSRGTFLQDECCPYIPAPALCWCCCALLQSLFAEYPAWPQHAAVSAVRKAVLRTVFPGSPSPPGEQGGGRWGPPAGSDMGLSLSMGPGPVQVLRSYDNIEEDCTVCPSWCLTLRTRGHSYRAASEHHVPQYSLHAPKVSVAPVAVGGGAGELGFCLGLKIPLRTLLAADTSQHPPRPSQPPHRQPWGLWARRALSWATLGLGALAPPCSI